MQAAGNDGAGMEPGLAEKLQVSLTEACQNQEMAGQPAILLTSGILRSSMSRFVKTAMPALRVLSYQEVPEDKQIRIVSSVGQ
jgi:flagellar biosynthesis protein FlhA